MPKTKKELTIGMLEHYLKKVQEDQIQPEMIIIYNGMDLFKQGHANWCGLSHDEIIAMCVDCMKFAMEFRAIRTRKEHALAEKVDV